MTKKTFIRNAAAAAVLAAIAAAPAWADDVTVTTQVTASIPASSDTWPDNITITGPHLNAPRTYTDTAPAAVLLPSGGSISITGTESVTIANSGIAASGTSQTAYSNGYVIATSDDAAASTEDSEVDYTGAVNGGSVDIETGTGGTISILRRDSGTVSQYQAAVLLTNAETADQDLTLTINGTNAASSVTVNGGIYLAGPNTSGLINLTGAGSSLTGGVYALSGASAVVNLKGEGSVINDVSRGMRQIDADGQASDGTASSVTLYTGAGTELDSYVTISDGATGTVTVDGTWTGRLTIGHYDEDSVKTEATVTVNGTWSGDTHSLGSNNSLTLNLNGVWDPGYDEGIMARNDDSDAAGSTVLFTIAAAQASDASKPAYFHGLLDAEGNAVITVIDNGEFTGDAWGGYEASGGTVNVTVNGTWTGNAIAGSDKYLFQDSEAEEEAYSGTGAVTVTIGKTGVWKTAGQTAEADEEDPYYTWWYAPRSVATESSPLTVTGSGAWDGGVRVTGGAAADITIGEGGSLSNTILSTEETASVTDGTLSVTDLGTWTGNAVASGASASLTTAVGGVWNGNLTAADGAAAAFSTLSGGTWTGDASLTGAGTSGTGTIAGTWNGNLVTSDSASAVLTVADGGVWNGNVTADTGSASVTVNGTWNGTVKSAEASQSTSTVSLFRVLAATVSQASAVGVDLTLGSTGNWNVPGDASVRNLTLAGGTVTFPTPVDAASFTGTTVTVTGDYTSDGGTLVMNTVLAGDGSASDKLAVEGSTSGTTKVKIQNVGGAGAQTADGIEMITVVGDSAGTFETADTVRAGAYVYSLTQNGKNWYLTSLLSPEPTPLTPDTTDITRHAVRPEMGSFATNLYAANTMFAMKLSDRLGETAFSDALKTDKNSGNVWIRTAGGHTRHEMADGENTTRGNWGLVQMGGDLVSWPTSGSHRMHVGLMAGYAHESAKTGSSVVNYQSKGKVSGYSVGIYGTWMNQKPEGSGPYADTWLMWSRFRNTVSSGNYTDTDTYHSKGFTWSIEGGYTFPLKDWRGDDGTDNAVRLQLQAQMIRMGVRDGAWTDAIGSTVQGIGAGNVRTRVGLKLYHQFTNDAKDRAWKPFIGLNWYHDTKAFGARIAGVADHIDGGRNFGEVKLGVEGKVKKNWNVWGFAGYQQGREGFRNLEALVGMKYLF